MLVSHKVSVTIFFFNLPITEPTSVSFSNLVSLILKILGAVLHKLQYAFRIKYSQLDTKACMHLPFGKTINNYPPAVEN